MPKGDIELPKDPGADLPTPPSLPKVAKPAFVKVPTEMTRVAAPRNSESVMARELLSDTRGPLTNRYDVERQMADRDDLQRQRDIAREKQREKEVSRPYQLKGSRSMSGKR